MKIFVLVFFTLASCSKERYEDAATLTDELLHELEKRLNSLERDYSPSQGGLSDLPKFHETKNSIIKTAESLEAGAVYLGSPELATKQLCQNECLKNWTCNLAVFKSKNDDTSCYLFNCQKPTVCSFVHHDGFSTSELPVRDTTRKGVSSEDDLELLAAQKPETTPSSTTTLKTTTTVTTTTSTPETPRQPVPLFGQCHNHQDCAGSYTQCLAGYCVCQENYHPQEGMCRMDCKKFEFECVNEGSPLQYPQCIAIYDKCDSFKHCHDGSDEVDCPKDSEAGASSDRNSGSSENKGSSSKFGSDAGSFIGHMPGQPAHSQDKSEEAQKPPADKSQGVPPKAEADSHLKETPEQDNQVQTQPPPQPQQPTEEKKIGDKEKVDTPLSSKGDSEETPTNDKVQIVPEAEEHQNNMNNNNNNKNPSSTSSPQKAPVEESKHERPNETIKVIEVEEGGSLVGVEVEEDGVDTGVAVVVQGNKGAVVALSLGLAITFLLLFFVGCRLRNVRKRLRRGRPMNSNEADYLINGMYL